MLDSCLQASESRVIPSFYLAFSNNCDLKGAPAWLLAEKFKWVGVDTKKDVVYLGSEVSVKDVSDACMPLLVGSYSDAVSKDEMIRCRISDAVKWLSSNGVKLKP